MQYGPVRNASLDASIDDDYEHDYEYDAPLRLRLCRAVNSKLLCAVAALGFCVGLPLRAADSVSVDSPDGRLQFQLRTVDVKEANGLLLYRVERDGQPIMNPSRLGFLLSDPGSDSAAFSQDFRIVSVTRTTNDTTWKPVYGERSIIRDHYNGAVVTLQSGSSSVRTMQLEVRAYDAGIAFCYRVPQQAGLERLQIEREVTEYRFRSKLVAWAVYSAQGVYEKTTLDKLRRGCERPLVLHNADGLYIAVAEARLVDYPRMKLAPVPREEHALVSDLSGKADCQVPFRFPWRVVMVADSPGELLENNDLILNLNDPSAIEDPSWIKPGKVIREVTLTTAGGKACVDFAAAHGLQYIEFDAGWYGHEYDEKSDATTITVDPKRSPGPLDLQEVIRYGDSKGIGVIVYVNRRALEKQLDEILPLYQSWGIRGVKYGFVNVGSQQWTSWLHEAVRQAAEHHLMVDVHDEYRPTGYSRTYPNLMTQEGIGGDETSPANEQTLAILFTRMIAGAGDNTICYYDGRVARNSSHAYQLAKAVCIYSPWQFLYWYDRPPGSPGAKGGAGGGQGTIGQEPELAFFAHVPTVWDDTRVIDGAIGQYAVIARRSGQQWYVGAMTDSQSRSFKLTLDFLQPDQAFTAHVYRDDPTVDTRTHVRIERVRVTCDTTLDIQLAPKCGQAMRIVPDR